MDNVDITTLPDFITGNFTIPEQIDIANALHYSKSKNLFARVSRYDVYCFVGGELVVNRPSFLHMLEIKKYKELNA